MLLRVLLLIALVRAEGQLSLEISSGVKRAITPEIKEFAQDLVHNGSVPGMTIGVVHSNGVVEFEAFGIKTEDGDNMTADVRSLYSSISHAL